MNKPPTHTPADKVAAEYFETLIGSALGRMYENFLSAPGIHATVEDVGGLAVARTFFLTVAAVGMREVDRIEKEIKRYGPAGANELDKAAQGDGVTVVDGVDGLVKHILETSAQGAPEPDTEFVSGEYGIGDYPTNNDDEGGTNGNG